MLSLAEVLNIILVFQLFNSLLATQNPANNYCTYNCCEDSTQFLVIFNNIIIIIMYDKKALLQVIAKSLTLLGVWPLKFNNQSMFWAKIYRGYGFVSGGYFTLFTASQLIQFFLIVNKDFQEILDNTSVLLLYSVVIGKLLVCKGRHAADMIAHVEATENQIFTGNDEKIKEIYIRHVKKNHFLNIVCIFFASLTIIPFFIFPVIEIHKHPEDYKPNNITEYPAKPLPFSSWFPFNKYKYYKIAYILHIIAGTYGCYYTACMDLFFISLMIFAIGQIKILQHALKNFRSAAKKIATKNDVNGLESAIDVVVRNCLNDHLGIIR